MSAPLVPASAVFSSSNMEPEQGEYLASAWARALAYNTGFLSYQHVVAPVMRLTGSAGDTKSATHYVYMNAGTYTVAAAVRGIVLTGCTIGYSVGGTVILGTSIQDGRAEGEEQVIIGTTAWVPFLGTASIVTSDTSNTWPITCGYRITATP